LLQRRRPNAVGLDNLDRRTRYLLPLVNLFESHNLDVDRAAVHPEMSSNSVVDVAVVGNRLAERGSSASGAADRRFDERRPRLACAAPELY
jgi:hypothetical protein